MNLRLVQQIELLPSVNNLGRIDFLNALEDAAAKFAPRLDSDVAQKGMRHFAEERLDQIQPGAVYRGVDIAERSRLRLRQSPDLFSLFSGYVQSVSTWWRAKPYVIPI